jgi:hypothetical protein
MHPYIAEQLVTHRRAQALADAHHSRLIRAAAANQPGGAGSRLAPWWRHRLSVGILGLVVAIVTFAGEPAGSWPRPSTSRLRSEPVTLVGLKALASEQVSYESGASRTWSAGPEIVGVQVLSGRLSVYGPAGERRVYIAGEGYAAGWTAYRTVNETGEPVEALVTTHVRP